jgi:hypothetical protein
MSRIPAREYARRHKMSLFQVIKKIQNGELQGEQIEENGLKIQYVLLPEESPEPGTAPEKSEVQKEKTDASSNDTGLHKEIRALKEELRELRKLMEQCCEGIKAKS